MTETKRQVHHRDCGEVGETGEHGDLGTNAADHPSRTSGAAKSEPSAADLDAVAQEQQAADATQAPEQDPKATIAAGLVKAGYSPEEAAQLADNAIQQAQARNK